MPTLRGEGNRATSAGCLQKRLALHCCVLYLFVMPTLREVNALADMLGLNKPSAQPGPVGSLDGLTPLARIVATAKVGDLITATREFEEGEYRLKVIGAPTEYEHPWYAGTRVIQVRVLRGRSEEILSVWADTNKAHLVQSRGLPKCLVALTSAAS